MYLKIGLICLAMLGLTLCINLKDPNGGKPKNILYFQSQDNRQVADQSTNDGPKVQNVCQNSTYYCSNLTCCSGPGSTFACCPILDGVCCADGQHCCPPHSRCDMAHQRCYVQHNHEILTTEWSIVDRDLLLQKQNIQEAVWCSDHTHYCPEGYECDLSAGICFQGTNIFGRWNNMPGKPVKESIICEDKSKCPSGTTCCKLTSGQYGCCPYEQAVCCTDRSHCCPYSYMCDGDKCRKGNSVVAWSTKVPAVAEATKPVTCGDESECPSGSTCCTLASGHYGCCPLEQAVCCLDNIHCCPKDYNCDVSSGTCSRGDVVVGWQKKHPAKPAMKWIDNSVICPGGQEQCPDGSTCCKTQTGDYGCCPYPKAVCCSDRIHCCPDGYQCNVSAGSCTKGNDILPWLAKKPAKILVNKV